MIFIVLNGIFDYEKVVYKYNPVYLLIGIISYILLIKYIYKKIVPKIADKKIIVYTLMGIFVVGCIFGRMVLYGKSNLGHGNSI